MSHEILQTERLTLRPALSNDAQAIFDNYAGDPEVTRFLQWRPQTDIENIRAFLSACRSSAEAGKEFSWVLAETPHGAALGMISLRLESSARAQIGYVLARPYWGRGYMPEAARAVIAHGLGALGRYRVEAYLDFENARSARVLEKAGMQFEGRLRRYTVHPNVHGEPRDVLMFAACR
jgi:[ribosomal protein S5]-alanine N-acetyltransferase